MKTVQIFTDGSSLGNPGPGGWCAILRFGEHERELKGGEKHTTNNRMELMAAIEGIRALKEPCAVTLFADSSYVVRGINEWIAGWEKKNFAKVKNPDLWREYLRVSAAHKVAAVWVRGHNGHSENERCDRVARGEAEIHSLL
ncbi:ribonuclease HI [Campylobacterota bacterium]|nr:ribonuclease HI [Campylobacterota bacterium]